MGGRISNYFNNPKYTEKENKIWEIYKSQYLGGIDMTCNNCGYPLSTRCECPKENILMI